MLFLNIDVRECFVHVLGRLERWIISPWFNAHVERILKTFGVFANLNFAILFQVEDSCELNVDFPIVFAFEFYHRSSFLKNSWQLWINLWIGIWMEISDLNLMMNHLTSVRTYLNLVSFSKRLTQIKLVFFLNCFNFVSIFQIFVQSLEVLLNCICCLLKMFVSVKSLLSKSLFGVLKIGFMIISLHVVRNIVIYLLLESSRLSNFFLILLYKSSWSIINVKYRS